MARAKAPSTDPFKGRFFAIGSTSNGRLGGYRALIALRQVLELGLGALVLPGRVLVHQCQAEGMPRTAASGPLLSIRSPP